MTAGGVDGHEVLDGAVVADLTPSVEVHVGTDHRIGSDTDVRREDAARTHAGRPADGTRRVHQRRRRPAGRLEPAGQPPTHGPGADADDVVRGRREPQHIVDRAEKLRPSTVDLVQEVGGRIVVDESEKSPGRLHLVHRVDDVGNLAPESSAADNHEVTHRGHLRRIGSWMPTRSD